MLLSRTRLGVQHLLRWGGCVLVLLMLLPVSAVRAQAPPQPQTFTVTTVDEYDSAADSLTLREAIDAANQNGNPGEVDVIEFNLSGTPPFTLALEETTLDPITQPVIIDATTQPGYDGTPLFVIDGSGLFGTSNDGLSLASRSDGSEIRGLAIVNFSDDGISVASDSNRVVASFIGVNTAGEDAGNGSGIDVTGDANTIENSVISGNDAEGIRLYYSNNNRVTGNYIGTDPTGALAVGNGVVGVLVRFGSATNVIGGTTAAARNVISGNAGHGIALTGGDGSPLGNVVTGNYIGTDAGGTAPLPNAGSGVYIEMASFTTIGDTTTDAANRIAFNGSHGVVIPGDSTTNTLGNAVRGNRIFENTGLGINLGNDGVTANDAANLDADPGPNKLQNFPEVAEATYSSSQNVWTVTYQVPTDPTNATYPLDVDFFVTDSGQQQGEVYIGTDTYTADDFVGGPETTIVFTPQATLTGAETLVATATDAEGNTSEFAAAARLLAPGLSVTPSSLNFGEAVVGDGGSPATLIVENTGGTDLAMDAITIGGSNPDAFQVTAGDGPTVIPPGVQREVEVTFLPESGGAKTGTLSVTSDAGSAEVDLSGTAFQIDLDPGQIPMPLIGEAAEISIAVPEGFQPQTSTFYYRVTGTSSYESLQLQPAGDGTVWTGTIPGEAVTVQGLDFYAEFPNELLTLTYPLANPASDPARLPARFEQLTPPGSFEADTYRMISIPAALDDTSLAAVFADYGAYEPDRWRVLRWNPASEAYEDLPELDDVGAVPGRAYWLVTKEGEAFSLGAGRSTGASPPSSITLQPGWNQIGNPYAFPVRLASLDLPPSVEHPVRFDGQEYAYDFDVLAPWEGYFVFNVASDPVTVSVPPVEASVDTAGGALVQKAAGFTMRLTAQLVDHSLRDASNVIGLAAGAEVGRDRMDYAEAPPIGDHVRLSIREGEERLAGSFKPTDGEGQWWDLEVTASVEEPLPTQKRVRIHLSEQGRRPEGYQRYVIDRDAGTAVAVEGGTFSVGLSRAQPVRHLRVILGTEAFAQAHAENASIEAFTNALEPNYPNPFARSTTIRYQVERSSRVVIDIYNMLGQRVNTLVDAKQKAGAYEVRWDGRNVQGTPVASGLYFCRMTAEDYQATRKLVLVR